MASLEDHHKANGARLSQLLIDKGTEAMRNVFDSIHHPATLTTTLNSHRSFLQRLRYVNRSQMDVMFPPSGAASKSEDFDITLLFVLLRNVCGLRPPVSTGSWDMNPPPADISRNANLARIKYYRNVVYGHITTTGVDDANFHSHWNVISDALVRLGVSEGDVKLLKFSPLEKDFYLDQIKEWKEKEDKLEVMLQESKNWQNVTTTTLQAMSQSQEVALENQKGNMNRLQAMSQTQDILLENQEGASNTLKTMLENQEGTSNTLQAMLQNQEETSNTLQAMSQNQEGTRAQLKSIYGKVEQTLNTVVQIEAKNTIAYVEDGKAKQSIQERVPKQPDFIQRLAKCDFKTDIKSLNKSFYPGTRDWLLERLDLWLKTVEDLDEDTNEKSDERSNEDSDSRVMILTAGPGVGKSVFAAKICQVYEERGQLAACHFCKFNYSDYSDPHKMLQSLASHMCDNVDGYREKLTEQLQRYHSRDTITDAFRVLMKDPLNSLPDQKQPMVIVIDGLDESESDGKSELLDLIAEEFSKLPKWMKIFITSRPELPVKNKLHHLNPVEILPEDANNEKDVKRYLSCCLKDFRLSYYDLRNLVKDCEGSFLYAHHYQSELMKLKRSGRLPAALRSTNVIPKGVGSFYEKYFSRLEVELKKLSQNINFERILEALAAMEGPLPLCFVAEILELPGDTRAMREVIRKVNESLSALLLVYNDCITVFHKTVVDWLLASRGYEVHSFTVSKGGISGHKRLWQVCRMKFMELERKGANEKENEAEKYALKHGIGHLKNVTYLPNYNYRVDSQIVVFDTGVLRLDRGENVCGYGWLIFQDSENVYIMTSSYVLQRIKHLQADQPQTARTHKPLSWCEIETGNYFVVVSSNKDRILDYAVLRLPKTSCNVGVGVGEALKVSKKCPEPGEDVRVMCSSALVRPSTVVHYPEDLVDWLKVRSCFTAKKIPSLSCNRSIDWNKTEDLKENLIPYRCDSFPGLPLFNSFLGVVGVSSFSVSSTETSYNLITFAVRIDKIIEDVNSKKPDLARKLFPTYFD